MSETNPELEVITPLTEQEEAEYTALNDSEKGNETEVESNRRIKLTFKKQANTFKARVVATQALIDDDIKDSPEELETLKKMQDNYASLASSNWNASL